MANKSKEMAKNLPSQPIQLIEGQEYEMAGQKYVVKNGELVYYSKEQESQQPSFKLVFKKYGGFGFSKNFDKNELKDIKISEDNKTYTIDIYPLLEKICGTERVNGAIKDYSGCVFEIPGEIGERKISFGDLELNKLERNFESLIDSVFTNSKQAISFRNLANKTLRDPFDDFSHLIW